MTVKNFLTFYNEGNRIEDELINRNGIIDVYGCCYKKKTKFKFVNTLEYYDAKLILHLVKITDHNTDLRGLIGNITNHKENLPIIENPTTANNTRNNTSTNSTEADTPTSNIRGSKNKILKKIQSTLVKQLKQRIGKDRFGKLPNYVIEELNKLEEDRKTGAKHGGRIPEDEQYSDPKLTDKENKATISFETSLKTKLTDCSQFNEQAKIVKTWYKSLSPGSIWEFNLTHHLGKGIHLNTLYDFGFKNKNHPSGYIFVLEQIGDRRGKMRRLKDKDFFTGYAPTEIHFDFEHKFSYLTEERNNIERTAT